MRKLFHSRLSAAGRSFELYSVERALVAIGLPGDSSKTLAGWLRRYFDGVPVEPADTRHQGYERQLIEYFEGRRRVFDLRYELLGTDFQKDVWNAVASIPYGRTSSYRDIAHLIGRPEASRAVGAANGANPIPIVIPCHRVIGANGSLTGYGGGLPLKRRLLALEGALRAPSTQMRLEFQPSRSVSCPSGPSFA
ncbi:MAG TPA: methylated-DNA--[protein]-cysteine S-methyltransferase [Vicinamibacteria bacterium]|nr:methylated-DNA--[protein]-cysteine S-methyltransferase [Vicinamibacteria bacterium]